MKIFGIFPLDWARKIPGNSIKIPEFSRWAGARKIPGNSMEFLGIFLLMENLGNSLHVPVSLEVLGPGKFRACP